MLCIQVSFSAGPVGIRLCIQRPRWNGSNEQSTKCLLAKSDRWLACPHWNEAEIYGQAQSETSQQQNGRHTSHSIQICGRHGGGRNVSRSVERSECPVTVRLIVNMTRHSQLCILHLSTIPLNHVHAVSIFFIQTMPFAKIKQRRPLSKV